MRSCTPVEERIDHAARNLLAQSRHGPVSLPDRVLVFGTKQA
ncbi:hypothetical protein SAMN06295924_103240 [Rathayibacter rathayi NCPPB 2980 = VKM Ac-1601]|nr:hypothetical protein [Rathayibacter rathayi]TWD64378.1 hypothetical protein FB469_2860 [Rathayibacter rathayi]SOE04164.1 hypothetical protein SAMN06295924_103240 [Rathayibacter rathayi NCPPB 2980 = VKM Ac-1601]